jgi:creatinine amidohydrolase
MKKTKFWQDMTTADFVGLDPNTTIALLPLGAMEQHGPHLPISTDATIAESLCIRAAANVSDDITVLVLPTQDIGKSTEHIQFEGTLTHSAKTLLDIWMEVGESVARAGIRKLVFVNGHGGQPQVMEIICRELRSKLDMLTVGCSGWSFGSPEADVPHDERCNGIHAGQVETSIMLHLRPDLVRMEHAKNYQGLLSEVAEKYDRLRILGSTYVGWLSNDLHPEGCSGDATKATAELGKLYVDHYSQALSELLNDVADYPLEWIRNREDWKR